MELTPEARRDRLATIIKWSAGLLGAAIISPVVFFAVKGLVGLALAAAIGLAITQFAPVYSTWIANMRMKALIAVVEANPIETMLNLYADKSHELAEADNHIAEFETEIRNFDDQCRDFKKQYPEEAESYEELSGKMHEALRDMKAEQAQARTDLGEFSTKIKKAQAIYKMAMAAQKVTRLSKSAEAVVFAQIKEQVAFDTVRTQLNRSFANLNLALERRDAVRPGAKALPASTSANTLPTFEVNGEPAAIRRIK